MEPDGTRLEVLKASKKKKLHDPKQQGEKFPRLPDKIAQF